MSDQKRSEVERYLGQAANVDDPDAASRAIVERIFEAETAEDILGGQQLDEAEAWLDKPFLLTGVRYNPSDLNESIGVYSVLEGKAGDGSDVKFSCGARNVMAQAWALHEKGFLPIGVVLKESKRPTARGYRPMWLEMAKDLDF